MRMGLRRVPSGRRVGPSILSPSFGVLIRRPVACCCSSPIDKISLSPSRSCFSLFSLFFCSLLPPLFSLNESAEGSFSLLRDGRWRTRKKKGKFDGEYYIRCMIALTSWWAGPGSSYWGLGFGHPPSWVGFLFIFYFLFFISFSNKVWRWLMLRI